MSNEIIRHLKPYALSVIDRFGKLKEHDFIQKLELTFKENNVEWSYFDKNRLQIAIITQQLIENAITDWLELQYANYPHATVRNGNKVISGKVESVEESSASSMYSFSNLNGWELWRNTGMGSGKKLQTVTLHDEEDSYYIVWGKDAIGIRKFNIVDFQWEQKGHYRIIVKNTLDGHGDGFGGSISIMVNEVYYPSIRSAHARIRPSISYSTVCTRLRNGMTPEDAFEKENMRANSDLNKLGIVIKKESWVKSHRKIS